MKNIYIIYIYSIGGIGKVKFVKSPKQTRLFHSIVDNAVHTGAPPTR